MPGETPERRRARYERNRALNAAQRKAWYAKNRAHDHARRQAYRAGCSLETWYRCRSSRCVICNVPPWTLERYRLGPMQVGHIVPGDAHGGFEPMCKKCNGYLGARRLTQTTGREVLRRSRQYWSRMQMRDEAWQHTDVDERGYGFGGINETPGRQRKLDAFEEEQHARREQREGSGGRTDLGSDGLSTLGEDDGVVLENTAEERNPEN